MRKTCRFLFLIAVFIAEIHLSVSQANAEERILDELDLSPGRFQGQLFVNPEKLTHQVIEDRVNKILVMDHVDLGRVHLRFYLASSKGRPSFDVQFKNQKEALVFLYAFMQTLHANCNFLLTPLVQSFTLELSEIEVAGRNTKKGSMLFSGLKVDPTKTTTSLRPTTQGEHLLRVVIKNLEGLTSEALPDGG